MNFAIVQFLSRSTERYSVIKNKSKTGIDLFASALARAAQKPAIHYFDSTLTFADLDELSNGLANYFAHSNIGKDDRVALYLQNSPHFVIAALAIWKLGAICVPVNPMNRERELAFILGDCLPNAVVCDGDLIGEVAKSMEPATRPKLIVRVAQTEFQTRNDPRIFRPEHETAGVGVAFAGIRAPPTMVSPVSGPDDIAMLMYTSGTTGAPKAAVIRHSAFVFNASAFPKAAGLSAGDAVLGIAPLFHITGFVACFGTALVLAAPLILTYRFDAGVVLEAIERWQPVFVVAAITAYVAFDHYPKAQRASFESLQKMYSGGAPVPAAFVERFEERFGRYIHNCYGLTETAAPTHIVPFGERAPLSENGVLSVGRSADGVASKVIAEDGMSVSGIAGELVIAGPMVAKGYWNNAPESLECMRSDGFRTGDIAIVDQTGWFYIVDRKKDMIISSGYKVWPREVEDVLYGHPAIREAAVVGVADAYRGETVKAVLSLRSGAAASAEEIIAYCRARMAAYKYPRIIDFVDELPKTASGKILRRAVRDRA